MLMQIRGLAKLTVSRITTTENVNKNENGVKRQA